MADEINTGAPAPQAPVTSPPAAATAPVSAPTSVASSPEGAQAPAVAPVSAAPESAPSALGSEPPAPELPAEKPADAPVDKPVEPPVDAPKEGDLSAETAPLPTFETFTFPEGTTFEAERLAEFTKELGEFETMTKAPHAEVQAFGQKLMDRHVAEVTQALERQTDYYTKAFEKQKADWKEAFQKDPEIGGNQRDTTVKGAVDFIGKFGGSPEQQTELRKFFNDTGTGNHPALIRLINNANNAIRGLTQEDTKMLPGKAPAAAVRSKVSTRYGNPN